MPFYSHIIEEQMSVPMRLDRYVSEALGLLSRSQIKTRCLKAKINGKDVKLSRIVRQNDCLDFFWEDSLPVNIIPQDIPLDIVYEDNNQIVVNKMQGMVVHPGAGNRQGTLANALYFRKLNMQTDGEINVNLRFGIVHRLDKETSGVIIAAYNDQTHAYLAEQFKERRVNKNYIAIVLGTPKEIKGKIETCITRDPNDRKRFTVSVHGKKSLTFYKIIKSWRTHSLLLLRPHTGRTHQLRVHMRHIGHPVLGDPVYGNVDRQFPDSTLMLHSKSLTIMLPGEPEKKIFSTNMPERFNLVIEKLNRMNIHE
jgi:23S rRNA pseudouridine1911/1915/1917 synthase